VPAAQKASATTRVYAAFNLGSVVALLLTPVFVTMAGYQSAFTFFGLLGMATAVGGLFTFRKEVLESLAIMKTWNFVATKEEACALPVEPLVPMSRLVPAMAQLVWAHSCIGFGFFVLQSWVPTFFVREFNASGSYLGFLSALPWIATAVCTLLAGMWADWLLNERKWSFVKVRRLMMTIATAGPAVCLVGLATCHGRPTVSALLMTGVLGMQAFSYSGFHTYMQEVCGVRAGTLLGITNLGGIVMGIGGNILAGYLAQVTGSFSLLFLLTAATYVSCGVLWNLCMRGEKLYVEVMPTAPGSTLDETDNWVLNDVKDLIGDINAPEDPPAVAPERNPPT